MKLYVMKEVAEKAGVGIGHVRSCYKWEILGGQRVAGTYVSTQNQLDAWLQSKTPPLDQPVLYSVLTAAEKAAVSTRQVRKAIESGDLPATKIATPGRHGWAYVIFGSDLDSVDLSPNRPGPDSKGTADAHIIPSGGRFIVAGTHNRKGLPYHYKELAVARRRARKAYQGQLVARPGEEVIIRVNGAAYGATILEAVTLIDQTIIVSIQGERHILPRKALPSIES